MTKEEKEKENTRKVAPTMNTMPPAGRPSSVQARPIYGILQDDIKAVSIINKDYSKEIIIINHFMNKLFSFVTG